MKSLILVIVIALLAIGSARAQTRYLDSCVVYLDTIPGFVSGYNPDSVLVDTCYSKGVMRFYARGAFEVQFDFDVYHVPSAPADTIIMLPWQAIDTAFDSIRQAFAAIESRWGSYQLKKEFPATIDTGDWRNKVYEITFASYVPADSARYAFAEVHGVAASDVNLRLLQVPLGVEIRPAKSFVFPNPARESLIAENLPAGDIALVNLIGVVVRRWRSGTKIMSLAGIPRGYYELVCADRLISVSVR